MGLSESQIQKQILDYLNHRPGKWWRMNTGAMKIKSEVGRDRFLRFGAKGMADIIGVKDGRFVAIEVKAEKGRTTLYQDLFREDITTNGGSYILARSVEDVMKAGI